MRSRVPIAVGTILLLGAAPVVAWCAWPASEPPHRCIFVTPRWPDGTPVQGAIAHAMAMPPDRRTGPVPASLPRVAYFVSLADGSAPVPWFPETLDDMLVRAWRREGKDVTHYGETIVPAGTPENSHVSVTLLPDRSLCIRVVDSSRRPLANVELHAIAELRHVDGTVAPAARCAVARTDEAGEATFFHAQAWLHRVARRDDFQPFVVRVGAAPAVAVDLDAADLPERRITLTMPAGSKIGSTSRAGGTAVAHDDAALGEQALVSGRLVAPRGVDDVTLEVIDGSRDANVATRVHLKPDGSFVVLGHDPGATPFLVVRSPEHAPVPRLAIRRGEADRIVTLVPRPAVEVPFRVASRELAVCLDYVLVRDDGVESAAVRRVWTEDGVMTCRFVVNELGPHRVVVRPKARKQELFSAPLSITSIDARVAPLDVPPMRVLRIVVPACDESAGTAAVEQIVAGEPVASGVADGGDRWLFASDEPIDVRVRVPGYREQVLPKVAADAAPVLDQIAPRPR